MTPSHLGLLFIALLICAPWSCAAAPSQLREPAPFANASAIGTEVADLNREPEDSSSNKNTGLAPASTTGSQPRNEMLTNKASGITHAASQTYSERAEQRIKMHSIAEVSGSKSEDVVSIQSVNRHPGDELNFEGATIVNGLAKEKIVLSEVTSGAQIPAIVAGIFVVLCIIGYMAMLMWRRLLEQKYGNREMLVNEDGNDPNDLHHFSFYDAQKYGDLDDDLGCSGDEEDCRYSSKSSESVEDALEGFRVKWQQELQLSAKHRSSSASSKSGENKCNWRLQHDENGAEVAEEKARQWFLKGAEFERSAIFYEAIQCYRKAVQLVPDIELKIGQKQLHVVQEKQNAALSGKAAERSSAPRHRQRQRQLGDAGSGEPQTGRLLQHIQRQLGKASHCRQAHDQKATHITALPPEIILLIFKWIVSNDLDLRSLEIASMVCRGWYLLARDDDIWRLACVRVWGASCSIGSPQPAPSWRSMYLQRPRPHYAGCYISKTSYFRHGENSFQDQFYRPWHLVCYYRYMRFFPDGLVLMHTAADEPRRCVGLLKQRNAKAVLHGHYRLKGDRVLIAASEAGKGERASRIVRIELEIVEHAHRCRHTQLAWRHYSIALRDEGGRDEGASAPTTLDVGNNLFPPLWFSRVKSYTSETTSPLC